MIAGLPLDSWLLLLVSVGLGLGVEIAFFRAHRKERKTRAGRTGGSDSGAGETVEEDSRRLSGRGGSGEARR